MATGKRRATFFNNIELEILMRAYGEFQHVFRKKCNTAAAAKERETAWENIASRLNVCNPAGEKRTWQQLKMKYKNIVQTDSDGAICLVEPPHATTDLDEDGEETVSAAFTEGDPERPIESMAVQQQEGPSTSTAQIGTVRWMFTKQQRFILWNSCATV
ncbi:hypothetical protein N1851_007934 [Merluccius polli]|uniref:Myb/SANT-like DNA-binding domain-containing protein n=1 Tax=Merluccius polli TaxID=89951 RepID=A0AA47N307_MERPO|nr:hypothetical protein N1851_007934 [Merluccius polli]